MDAQQIAVLCVVLVGGMCVLSSYIPVVKDYKNYDYWFGISKPSKTMFYVFWVLAALGFLWYVLSLLLWPLNDAKGLLSYKPWIRPLLLAAILVFSAAWSVLVWKRVAKAWVVGALVLVAVATILLLAGEAETDAPWHRVLGLMSFAATTVLIDPIQWSAKYVLS